MKMSKFLSILVITCMLITLFPTAIVAEGTHSNATGVISLPGNTKASDDVKVTLIIGTNNLTESNKNDDVSVSHELVIPKGQNSISFSTLVPKSSSSKAKYTVYYTVGSGYAPFGWYSKNGTTAVKDDRTQIDLNAGDVKNIKIELLAGRKISGKIILGNDETTLIDDMKYTVTAIHEGSKSNTSDDDIIITKDVTIKAGQDDKSYELIVPPSADSGYKVYYSYTNDGYKETGFYHKDGTSYSANKVTKINVSNTQTGINLTTKPFTNIFGKLYLPDGGKAPKKGITAIITAENHAGTSTTTDDFSFMKTVEIKEGANSVSYSIAVPVKSTDYAVSYTISDEFKEYVAKGFYDGDETVTSYSKATLVEADEDSVTGINMTIIEKNKPKPTPTPKPDKDYDRYDLNEDGYVNVFDMLDLAKVIVKKYDKEGFDKNLEQYKGKKMDSKDLEIIRDAFLPFTNNKYKTKWFDSLNKWFNFDKDFEWDFDKTYLENFDWKEFDWEEYWKNYDWEDFDWEDYCKNYNWKASPWGNFQWGSYNWEDWSEWFDWDDDDDKNNKDRNKNNTGNKSGWYKDNKKKKN